MDTTLLVSGHAGAMDGGEDLAMRFPWFHRMPYPFLPDGFKQKYHSIWVDVASAATRDLVGHGLTPILSFDKGR